MEDPRNTEPDVVRIPALEVSAGDAIRLGDLHFYRVLRIRPGGAGGHGARLRFEFSEFKNPLEVAGTKTLTVELSDASSSRTGS
jgi:hypothetical protein